MTFCPASFPRSRSMAVFSRAAPPKQAPLASSSAEQVASNLLIGSMRLCQSLKCRMVSV
jgi:hypothetical protein